MTTPEAHADDMEDRAAILTASLRDLASATRPSLDPRAVFLAMGRTVGQVRESALELARQEWVDISDDAQARERWGIVLKWLDTASGFFEEVADGWI